MTKAELTYCLIVPHFNHVSALAEFLPTLTSLGLPCVVVDDGSDAENYAQLQDLLQAHPAIHLFAHQQNRGKGAAVTTACTHARSLGFTHGIQIDADGQHDVADVKQFIAVSQAHPEALVSGHPQFDDSAPKARLYGRKVTDFWVALETWSLKIKDSLCGFRVYPLTQFEQVADRFHIGTHMDFDTDIMVKSVWLGVPVKFVPTKVIYHKNSVSHFHYLRDNMLLISLHTRLMLGMLLRSPCLAVRRVKALFVAKSVASATQQR